MGFLLERSVLLPSIARSLIVVPSEFAMATTRVAAVVVGALMSVASLPAPWMVIPALVTNMVARYVPAGIRTVPREAVAAATALANAAVSSVSPSPAAP